MPPFSVFTHASDKYKALQAYKGSHNDRNFTSLCSSLFMLSQSNAAMDARMISRSSHSMSSPVSSVITGFGFWLGLGFGVIRSE